MVEVIESYDNYVPLFAVRPLVEEMLGVVPARYLAGLKRIVLTNTKEFTRRRRRSWTRSRGRKVQLVNCRGAYHPRTTNNLAWIEIFVDKTIDESLPRLFLRLPVVRDHLLSDVVYHEVGHHIHHTVEPEHREEEDVADYWKLQLSRRFFPSKYWYLKPLAYSLHAAGYAVRRIKGLVRKRHAAP